MSLFGKKEKQGEVQQELDMLIATTENIGRPYEIIGLVATRREENAEWDYNKVVREMVQKSKDVGADAIVGFRYNPCYDRAVIIFAYGTAVKFK